MTYQGPVALLLAFVGLMTSVRAQSNFAPAMSADAARGVIVRTLVQPEQGAVVGQRVQLFVDVLFRGQMPRPPTVSLPDVGGAQTLRLETQATTISETIGGASYNGQRFEFAIYPRRGGELTVPAARVALYDQSGATVGEIEGEAVRAQIVVPPGMDASRPVVATRQMELVETWAPETTKQFNAGGAITRTITRTADDIPAFAMRDLEFTAPPGVQAYVEPPVARDKTQRGVLTGQRIDRVTYVFERSGAFDLPAVSDTWWDLRDNRLKTVIGDGASLLVAAAPAEFGPNRWLSPVWWRKPSNWALAAGCLGIVMTGCWLSLRALGRLRQAWTRYQTRSALSEAKAFGHLMASCRAGDAQAIYMAFKCWCDRLPDAAANSVRPESAELERALFALPGIGVWSSTQSSRFAEQLKRLRPELLRKGTSRKPSPLPPLNPVALRGAIKKGGGR